MEFIDLKTQYQRLKADIDASNWGQIPINLKLYAHSAVWIVVVWLPPVSVEEGLRRAMPGRT